MTSDLYHLLPQPHEHYVSDEWELKKELAMKGHDRYDSRHENLPLWSSHQILQPLTDDNQSRLNTDR
jgi:hypothetical protein